MTAKGVERIQKISEEWFLTEPLIFSVFCTHKIFANDSLKLPFRTGKRRIEYCEIILEELSDFQLEQYLRVEIMRILLKHPYQRQPLFAVPSILTYASNYTLNDTSKFSVPLEGVGLFDLPSNLCFEEYYELIRQQLEQENDCGNGNQNQDSNSSREQDENENPDEESSPDMSKAVQISELWEEDSEIETKINEMIEIAESANQWGTISGNAKSKILASLRINVDYRKMLSFYRTSILSSRRHLTRMRPSRRYGFDAMGSRYDLKSNLLVAVDVSGSVTDKVLSRFYSIINRFFKYGIEKIDVIQFDSELKGEPVSLKKAGKKVAIFGRGGTNFEVPVFYCMEHKGEYDGLIIFTDGYAPIPNLEKCPVEILWVLQSYEEYQNFLPHLAEAQKRGKNRATYIPLPI